jgi:hypothetical protein
VNEDLRILNQFYKQALLYEFDLTNRSKEFLAQFEDVIFT